MIGKFDVMLRAENLSKQYRLGLVGTGTLSHDLNRYWHLLRGKSDPYLQVGQTNDRSKQSSSDYVWALKDVSFDVNRGDVLGIIGKNGSGKSTLLKLLSRVSSPTTGVIKSKGRIASLLEVGTGFHPELTGKENIYLNGAILGMTKNEINSKIDEIIEFSGCQLYIDTPVKRYSSGMRVRLAFAVAAHLEPDILIVDEVLAVGDAEFQKKAIGKMKDISSGDGRTVLFVSHDMAAIRGLCTRLMVLENGESVFEGSVDDGLSHYLVQKKPNVANLKFGEHTINSIDIENSRNFKVGSTLSIRLRVSFLSPLTDLIVLFIVKNNMGESVAEFHSKGSGARFDVASGNAEFVLNVPQFNIHFGLYELDLILYDGRTRYTFESIESINCTQSNLPVNKFHMKGNDFYFNYSYEINS